MMIRSRILWSVVALAAAACGGGGGGGGSGSAPPPAATPPPVGVTASGVITGFGSVIVGDDRYVVAPDTVVAIQGEQEVSGDDSMLRIGMKVRIRAIEQDDERVAERIEYDDDLKGPARDVMPDGDNPAIGTFTLMRQTVIVDDNTIFDDDVGDNDADGAIDIRDLTLPNGEVVIEVSGHPIADGFLATRIERVDNAAGDPDVDDDEFELKGLVDAVAGDGSSFTINDATILVVAGAGGTAFEDGLVPDQTLVGRYVEVALDENEAGELIAVEVELEDAFEADPHDKFEIEGILVSVDLTASPHVVIIGSVTLEVADASALVGLEGALIELEGTLDDDGVLVLDEIEPELENNVRVEDLVRETDAAAGTITTRLGVVVTPTGASRIEDDVDEPDDHLTPEEFLERVMADDYIKARGFGDLGGAVTWTRVARRDEDDTDCRLRGPVESIDGDDASNFEFVIQGVIVDVSQIMDDEGFEAHGDQPLGRQAFFELLDVGDVVQAESDDAGTGCEPGRLSAESVEFELNDDVVGSMPPADDDDDGIGLREIMGIPADVTATSFSVNGETVTVIGSTLIDDSIIEAALGREIDGDDQRFDQLPAGLTLPDLLPGSFAVEVLLDADGVALSIEDL